MTHRIVRPDDGELVSFVIRSPFLLVDDEGELSSARLHLFAGQLPTGAAGIGIDLPDTDYGREIAAAVRETVHGINGRWGLLGDWRPKEFDFTGDRHAPFRKKD